jgi:O-antigen ligase
MESGRIADGKLILVFRERTRRFTTGGNPSPASAVADFGTSKPTPAATFSAPSIPAPVSVPVAPPVDLQWESEVGNPLRRITFYFALAAIFIRFSVIHEVLAVILNLNLYLLYIVMPPAILGVILTGGMRRTIAATSGKLWLAFLAWMFIAAPTSSWLGGSVQHDYSYLKAEYLMLFITAGLAMTWKECLLVMYTLVGAALTDLLVGRTFANQTSDRMDLAMGGSTIANSNDFAAHLILMMAFLLFLAMAPKIPAILRLVCIPAVAYGIFLVLGSGSRGALIALVVAAIFTFVMGSSKLRMILVITLPLAAVIIVAALPRATFLRLGTLVSDSGDAAVQGDAEGSSEARRALFKKSIEYTFLHPVFGVGPGRFSDYEGGESQKAGQRGMWHETHNSFTQISSECGIPALIFFVAAIVSAFRLALKTYRQARLSPMNADISAAMFCLMLGIIGFMSAITFANFGYRFYEPAMCGLCIAMYGAAQHEMAARKFRAASAVPAGPLWAPAQPFPKSL